jgi:hypothetical protein
MVVSHAPVGRAAEILARASTELDPLAANDLTQGMTLAPASGFSLIGTSPASGDRSSGDGGSVLYEGPNGLLTLRFERLDPKESLVELYSGTSTDPVIDVGSVRVLAEPASKYSHAMVMFIKDSYLISIVGGDSLSALEASVPQVAAVSADEWSHLKRTVINPLLSAPREGTIKAPDGHVFESFYNGNNPSLVCEVTSRDDVTERCGFAQVTSPFLAVLPAGEGWVLVGSSEEKVESVSVDGEQVDLFDGGMGQSFVQDLKRGDGPVKVVIRRSAEAPSQLDQTFTTELGRPAPK